jgi:hypothetical protein
VIGIELRKQTKKGFLDRMGDGLAGTGWFVPQRIKCVCCYKAVFQDYTQIMPKSDGNDLHFLAFIGLHGGK